MIHNLIDLFLHLDAHLQFVIQQYGAWNLLAFVHNHLLRNWVGRNTFPAW